MTARLVRRELAIAAAALLAGSAAFAATERARTPVSLLPEAVGSYVALAGELGPATLGRRTACGVLINGDTDVEPDEIYVLTISQPPGANFTLVGTTSVSGTILNDDGGTPSPSPSPSPSP